MNDPFRKHIDSELNKMTDKEKLAYAQRMEDNLYEFGYPYPVSDEAKILILEEINRIRGSIAKANKNGSK